MSEPQALAQLKDIQLPQPIGWWPLAPGWYLLAGLTLILVMTAVYYLYRYYSYGRAKREALKILAAYCLEYQNEGNSQVISAKVSELLRRVALVYYPRKQVASLHGEPWINFLNSTGKNINFNAVRECLLELPYQEDKDINLKPLLVRTRNWIKQRRVPCLN